MPIHNVNLRWSSLVEGKYAPIPNPRTVIDSYMMTVDLKKATELLEQPDGEERLLLIMAELRQIVSSRCDSGVRETLAVSSDSIDLLYHESQGMTAVADAILIQQEIEKSLIIADGCCISLVYGEIVVSGDETSGPSAILSWSLAAAGNKGSILMSDETKKSLNSIKQKVTLHRFTPREFSKPANIYEILWAGRSFGIREKYLNPNP